MDTKILQEIWARTYTKGAFPFLALIDRQEGDFFLEKEWRYYPNVENYLIKVPGQDHFFSPLHFWGARKNENATGLTVLFADLDNWKNSKEQLHQIWPHALWLTSDMNAQAVWFLDAEVPEYSAWADLNQRMTYFMGADKGGWHGSKLLRIPGSSNFKYDPPQQGMAFSFQPKAAPYKAEALRAILPLVERHAVASMKHPDPKQRNEWKLFLASIWHKVPLQVKTDLLSPTIRDRSYSLVRAANKMLDAGIRPEDVFQALWWTEWNKFRTDRHDPGYLWQIITSHEAK